MTITVRMAQMGAQLVVGNGADVVEFVHGDQAVVEHLDPEPVHGKAEGGMGADQDTIVAVQKPLCPPQPTL